MTIRGTFEAAGQSGQVNQPEVRRSLEVFCCVLVMLSCVCSLFDLFVFQRLASFPALNVTFFFGLISKYEKKKPAPLGMK